MLFRSIGAITDMSGTWTGCSFYINGADYPVLGTLPAPGAGVNLDLRGGATGTWIGKATFGSLPNTFFTGGGNPSAATSAVATLDAAKKTATISKITLKGGQSDPAIDITGTITCP